MRSKFDQQLALLNEELTQMGETCAKAIGLAAQALENQDAATAAPDTKYCAYCGEKIPVGSKFCPKCGAQLPPRSEKQET